MKLFNDPDLELLVPILWLFAVGPIAATVLEEWTNHSGWGLIVFIGGFVWIVGWMMGRAAKR